MSREERIATITKKLPQLSEQELEAIESVLQAFIKEDEESMSRKQKEFRRALFEESVKEDKELLKRLAK